MPVSQEQWISHHPFSLKACHHGFASATSTSFLAKYAPFWRTVVLETDKAAKCRQMPWSWKFCIFTVGYIVGYWLHRIYILLFLKSLIFSNQFLFLDGKIIWDPAQHSTWLISRARCGVLHPRLGSMVAWHDVVGIWILGSQHLGCLQGESRRLEAQGNLPPQRRFVASSRSWRNVMVHHLRRYCGGLLLESWIKLV